MPRVWNKKLVHPADAVLIDRTTPFGNPFVINPLEGVTREVSIKRYWDWIVAPEQKELRRLMRDVLVGEDLMCWCKPLACHGDIVLQIANSPHDTIPIPTGGSR